ncbi:hypothetical protein ACIOKD_05365 [Streptomyces sp. NPDC087844]|uniref:hypothetical protein n=1 Tax=Streptomyces sp. NPDC087844 TaxID=3365805 RepID=UPI0038183786
MIRSTKTKMSTRSARTMRATALAAVLAAGAVLIAPTAHADPDPDAAPVPDLVCRLDAEVNFDPPLGLTARNADVYGVIGYHDCRSPSGAARELTDIDFHVRGTGRFGAVPAPTFSVQGHGKGTWNTGDRGGLDFKGDLKTGSPVPDRKVTEGPLTGDEINGLQIPRPRYDKINPRGVAGFDVFGQVCFWKGEKGRCTDY